MKKILLVLFTFLSFISEAQKTKVMVMDIKDEIDSRMSRYVTLGLAHAEETKADIVIIEMDTYGGVLTDAIEIAHTLLDFKKPVWVFINTDAASAGAFISIACDSIYMTERATIGAATVVNANGEVAPEKYQSYFREQMHVVAEANHRNPEIAEGMVSERNEIPGIKKEGEIITLTTSKALEVGYCEAQVKSLEEILMRNKVKNYDLDHFELGAADSIVAFFLNPFISGLLILIIIGGIYLEMQAPGVSIAGIAALVATVLYLVPYYLNGLAENWEIIALFAGIVLIAVEIFLLPGFGVAGISGITLTVGSLVLIMINNDAFDFEFVRMNDILIAFAATMGGIVGGIVIFFVAGARLADTKFYSKVALTTTQQRSEGFTASSMKESLKGKTGIAHTILRPSGRVVIEGTVYDAYTQGEYAEKGQTIVVVNDEGTSLKVRVTG